MYTTTDPSDPCILTVPTYAYDSYDLYVPSGAGNSNPVGVVYSNAQPHYCTTWATADLTNR